MAETVSSAKDTAIDERANKREPLSVALRLPSLSALRWSVLSHPFLDETAEWMGHPQPLARPAKYLEFKRV